MKTRFAKVFVLLTLVVAMVAMMAIPAMATEVTVLDGQVSITDNQNKNTVSDDGTVTIQAVGGNWMSTTNQITVKNNTSSKATLVFDYTASNYSQFTVNGSDIGASGTFTVDLMGGEKVTISLTASRKNTATLTISNLSLTPVTGSANVTIQYDSALGSVTVGGAAVTSGTIQQVSLSDGVTLVATPNSGTTFLAWIDAATGAVLSQNASLTLIPSADMTAKAVFVNNSSTAWFWANKQSALFNDLNAASDYAVNASNKTIVLANNGTLPAGSYTVDSGVTLLIPYDAGYTLKTTVPACVEKWVKPTQYRALTMVNGASITVHGALCVGGQQSAEYKYNGMPSGPVGFIKMNTGSSISVENKAFLYAWGYITGSGSVAIKSGGTVYEHFQLADYRGGQATVGAADNAERVFPMSQYYIQNIEVPMKLYAGASEYAYMSTNVTLLGIKGTRVPFVGDSGAMFKISSGYAIKDYLEGKGRMLVEAHGDMSATSVSIKMQTTMISTTTIDSAKYYLPISNHFTIDLAEGNFYVAQDLVLYPGAELNIRKGTTATLAAGAKVVVYDVDQWVGCCAASNSKYIALPYVPGGDSTATRLRDAQVLIDGIVEAEGAAIYTTAGGANVYSTGTGVVNIAPGTESSVYYIKQNDTSITSNNAIPIQPALLKNADGTFLNTKNGGKGTMRQYAYSSGKWICDAGVNAHTCEHTKDVVKAPTCTEQGYTTHTCAICGYSYTGDVTEATGHQNIVNDAAVPPTCTTTGLTEGAHCADCGTVITAQKEVSASGHSYESVVTAPTCTADGYTTYTCSICGDTYTANGVAALGHNDVTIPAVAPTLTKTGLAEGVRCDRCNEVLTAQEEIAALLKDIQWNMTLAGDLTVNLYVYADDSVKASVTFCEETTEYPVENGICTIPVKVSAAQMADSIILTITNGDDKVEKEYSVAMYAQKILDDEKQEAYHALVQAMLNYGAAAQKYFGYNTDNIVNGTESATEIPESTEEMKVNVTNENIRFYGASLVYREKIAVRFYFIGNAEGIAFVANGKPYTASEKNGLWCVEVSDVMPQELNQQITLTAEGVEVSYGPMNYIVRMNQKGDAKLQTLMKELYNYHLAASGLVK